MTHIISSLLTQGGQENATLSPSVFSNTQDGPVCLRIELVIASSKALMNTGSMCHNVYSKLVSGYKFCDFVHKQQ